MAKKVNEVLVAVLSGSESADVAPHHFTDLAMLGEPLQIQFDERPIPTKVVVVILPRLDPQTGSMLGLDFMVFAPKFEKSLR
jgi:hypothetical protein